MTRLRTNGPSERTRVFLCHSSGDKAAVRALRERLVEDGFEPWLDEVNLLPGQDWQLEIAKAVRSSTVVLVCLSEASVNKAGFVQKEIRLALDVADEQPEGRIFIIPVRLAKCDVPTRLGQLHWVDLFSADGYFRLAAAIRTARSAVAGSPEGGTEPSALSVALATDIGRYLSHNQDFVQAENILHGSQRYAVWAVADGDGAEASRVAVEVAVAALADEPWTDPRQALVSAFTRANHSVRRVGGERNASTTLLMALVSDPQGVALIANVGDSRAYVTRDFAAIPITDDHLLLPGNFANVRKDNPNRYRLSRSIGAEPEVEVDVLGPHQLLESQRLILCTFGLYQPIGGRTIGELGGRLPLAQTAEALVAAAVGASGRYNATALVGEFAGFKRRGT